MKGSHLRLYRGEAAEAIGLGQTALSLLISKRKGNGI